MKTTLNIADDLLETAKEFAKKENTTLTEIVETSLKVYLSSQGSNRKPIKWKKSHFGKNGLVDGLQNKSWAEIRDISYGLQK